MLVLLVFLGASPLTDAAQRYADLDYEGCVSALAPGLAKLRGAQRAQGELYFGLCQFALGREPEARKHLEIALRVDAALKPPAAASPKERQLFDDVVRFVTANPRAPAPKRLPPPPRKPGDPSPPPPEPEPEPEPWNDAPVAEPPPGVPAPAPSPAPVVVIEQAPKQRSYALPTVLTVATLLGAGAGITLGVVAGNAETQGRMEPVQVRAKAWADRAGTLALGANVAFAVTAALGVAALIAWLWSAL